MFYTKNSLNRAAHVFNQLKSFKAVDTGNFDKLG